MNKIKELKNKLFSLPKAKLIPILVVGVLVAGVASAGLVSFLSNVIGGPMEVTSPTELKLYDEKGEQIETDFPVFGGSTIRFFKIVKSDANEPVPMAIALVAKGIDMNNATLPEFPELKVTSAGPCGASFPSGTYTEKCVYYDTGIPYGWDNPCWCQQEGQPWYLHGQCSDGIPGEQYDDTIVVWAGNTPYSVILFGGTFDDVSNKWDAKVVKTGWGTPTSCNATEELTMIAPGGYDTGKVKVTVAPNLDPEGDYDLATQVVMPGSTVAEIIAGMSGD